MNIKKSKVFILLFLLFMGMFCINIEGVNAGGMISGGHGTGYAQCAYMWDGDTKIVANESGSSSAKEVYRLIIKAYGSSSNGANTLNWTEKMTKSANYNSSGTGLTTDSDTNITNYEYLGAYGNPIDSMYTNGSFSCPSKICYREPISYGGNYAWYFSTSGKCLSNYETANLTNWEDWTVVSQTEKSGPTIVAKNLSERAQHGTTTAITDARPSTNNNHNNISNNHNTGTNNVNSAAATDMLGGLEAELINIFKIMQIAGIIILIVLSMLDVARAVTSGEDDKMKKISGKLVRRLIALAILLILPVIINLIIDILVMSGVTEVGGFDLTNFSF